MKDTAVRARCITGIEGLDSILGGGIPTGSLVLVTGVPGVGKTSLALEFAVRGAAMGERSLVLTTVERPEKLIASVPEFDFFDHRLMEKGMLTFLELSDFLNGSSISGRPETSEDFSKLGENISKYILEHSIKRLVIDTYHTIFYGIKDDSIPRDLLLTLSETMYVKNCTGILVADANPSTSIESIISDGVIILGNLERRSDLLRTMQVLKMKATCHSRAKYVIDLTTCGVLVTPPAERWTMSEDVGSAVAKRLNDVGPSVAVALEFPMGSYFDVLRGLVDDFAQGQKLSCVYITSAVPATTINASLEALEIDTTNILFVDTISQMIMGDMERASNKIIYVESPTVLENVILKVDFLSRRLKGAPMLVVVDSINSLAIHNDTKMLSEFLHVLISGLSAKEAYPVILSIKEQLRPEVHEMLNLVCDQVIDLGHPE